MGICLKPRSFLLAAIFVAMILSPLAPNTEASSEEYDDSTAFLEGGNISAYYQPHSMSDLWANINSHSESSFSEKYSCFKLGLI